MIDVNIVLAGSIAESRNESKFLRRALTKVSPDMEIEISHVEDADQLRQAARHPALLTVLTAHGGWYRPSPEWKFGIGSPSTDLIRTPMEWFEGPENIGGNVLLVLACDQNKWGVPDVIEADASWKFVPDRLVIVGVGEVKQGDMSAAVRAFARIRFTEVSRNSDELWRAWMQDMEDQKRPGRFRRANST